MKSLLDAWQLNSDNNAPGHLVFTPQCLYGLRLAVSPVSSLYAKLRLIQK